MFADSQGQSLNNASHKNYYDKTNQHSSTKQRLCEKSKISHMKQVTRPKQSEETARILSKTSGILVYAKLYKSVIFFKCLKKTTTPETIREVFSQFGHLVYVQLPYNKVKRRNIGYGYVVFDDNNLGQYLVEKVKSVIIDDKTIVLTTFVEKRDLMKMKDIEKKYNFNKINTELQGDIVMKQPFEKSIRSSKAEAEGQPNEFQRRLANDYEQFDCRSMKQEEDQSTKSDVESIIYLGSSRHQHHSSKPTSSAYFKIERDSYYVHEVSNLKFRTENESLVAISFIRNPYL